MLGGDGIGSLGVRYREVDCLLRNARRGKLSLMREICILLGKRNPP